MIVGVALILGLIGAWALGADLSRLSALRFRGEWLVFAALAIQVVLFTGGGHGIPERYDAAVHLASYLLLLLFVALNLRISGFWMVGVGLLSNVIAIFANGGSMPVTLEAWRASGADPAILQRTGWSRTTCWRGRTPTWRGWATSSRSRLRCRSPTRSRSATC